MNTWLDLKPIQSLSLPSLPLNPFTLPLELAKASLDLQAVDGRDTKRLENVRILTDLLSKGDNKTGGDTTNIMNAVRNRQNNLPVRKLLQEASKRRLALTRIGVRFGGTLASVQAERLRERANKGASGDNDHSAPSDLEHRLASRGADTLETLVKAISNLDNNILSEQR